MKRNEKFVKLAAGKKQLFLCVENLCIFYESVVCTDKRSNAAELR